MSIQLTFQEYDELNERCDRLEKNLRGVHAKIDELTKEIHATRGVVEDLISVVEKTL